MAIISSDNRVVSELIKILGEQPSIVVGWHGTARQAVAQPMSSAVDVVVLDLEVAAQESILHLLKHVQTAHAVVLVTRAPATSAVAAALSLAAVSAGADWLDMAAPVLRAIAAASRVAISAETTLTRRELEVLAAVRLGLTNQQIARHLQISVHTVNRHLANMLAKLGAKNRMQLVARLMQRRTVDAEEPPAAAPSANADAHSWVANPPLEPALENIDRMAEAERWRARYEELLTLNRGLLQQMQEFADTASPGAGALIEAYDMAPIHELIDLFTRRAAAWSERKAHLAGAPAEPAN